MVLTYYVGGKIVGLESERPLTNNLPANTTFIETDTLIEYIWDGVDTWNKIGVAPPIDLDQLLAYFKFDEASGNLINQAAAVSTCSSFF